MSVALIVLILSFLIFLAMDMPVAFCLGLATVLGVLSTGELPAFLLVAQRMAAGIDSFALLAIPFFILSGQIMERGGIARKLIDAAEVLVGQFRGGLAFVNVLTCMLFGSISGSAAAAVSSVGGFMVPVMNDKGYDREFNAALTTCAATTGLLIPPSNIMIIYSMATGGDVAIAAIFIGGIIPGILVGLALMLTAGVISVRRNYGQAQLTNSPEPVNPLNPLSAASPEAKGSLHKLLAAVPALLLVIIVLGGILGGVFTATEASAVAVVYCFILTLIVDKSLSLSEIPDLLLQSGVVTSVVMLLIACSTAMAWLLAHEHVPQVISQALLGLSDNPYVILLLINIILLAVGTFMDMTPAVLVFTPIFLPVVKELGMDPVQFGVVLIMNLCIGLCTPPVGTCLFLGCGIAETTMTKMLKDLIPFFLAMIAVLLLTTYVPALSMALPRALGQ